MENDGRNDGGAGDDRNRKTEWNQREGKTGNDGVVLFLRFLT
jgi:hypothetical protein